MQTDNIKTGRRSTPVGLQRWLLLFNCQASGLASCLSLQCAEIDVEFHDHQSAAQNRSQILSGLDDYDLILVEAGRQEVFPLRHRENVWVVPPIWFHALQPDMCWFGPEFVRREKWPLGDWHSIIGYTAYTLGLTLEQALALYRDDVYSALGYYARWDREAEAFYRRYAYWGFDMKGALARWNRSGAFMHLPFHPKIECLNDLARAILRRAALPVTGSDLRPPDNLFGGPVFPVYPEIGRRLGIAGDYIFKLGGRNCLIDLSGFVERNYRHYDGCSDLTPGVPRFAELLQSARGIIAAKTGIFAELG